MTRIARKNRRANPELVFIKSRLARQGLEIIQRSYRVASIKDALEQLMVQELQEISSEFGPLRPACVRLLREEGMSDE